MEKYYWKIILAGFLIIFIDAIISVNCAVRATPAKEYPLTAIVTEISEDADTVTIQDFCGNTWTFKGVEDWMVGDFAGCIMNDKGTQSVLDDEIVAVRYTGYLGGWGE